MRVIRHFLLLIGVLGVVSPVLAASARAKDSSVLVNEIEVLTLRTSVASRSPKERATLLASEFPSGASQVSARNEGSGVRIRVDDKDWVLVTPTEAKATLSSPSALARIWVQKLQRALALPPVKLLASDVKAPVAGTRYVSLIGSLAREAVVKSSDEKVLKVSRIGATLVIEGVGSGTAQADIQAGTTVAKLNVLVQPCAAYFPQTVNVAVTGTPATQDTVSGAVASVVNSGLKTVPNAQVYFQAPKVSEIAMGDSKMYTVRVRVAGPESFPTEGVVAVVVKNAPIGYRSEAALWYCNNPERIRKPQRVFCAGLKVGEPVRMLYHHVNGSASSLIMHVEAINNSATPARVLIMPGDADPNKNPVKAGFNAADRFVRAWSKYSGEVVEIPPYSILPISLRRMGKEDTISGLCYMRLLEGGPQELVVRAEARLPRQMERKWRQALSSPTPWQITGCKGIGDLASVPEPDSAHIYPNPFKEEEVTYNVGGPYGFIRIGQTPIARRDNQGSLDGNFGVLYTIRANLENDTQAPADVELVYESSAGYSQGLFLINGEVRRTPQLSPKEEMRISRIRLEPHTTASIRIQTVPLSGSAYPATLTIRPVQKAYVPKSALHATDASTNRK